MVSLRLAQRRRLDLVVDDERHLVAVCVRPHGFEVEEAEHAPFQARAERVLHPSLHRDRLAEPRDERLEGQLDRVEAELERAVLAQVVLPADPELLALGLGGGLPSIPVGVPDLVER